VGQAQSSYTWNGASPTSGNWSDTLNWSGGAPTSPQGFLNFTNITLLPLTTRLISTHNFASASVGYQIYFKSGANAFNLYGNSIAFYDFGGGNPNIQNEGAFTNQTVNFPILDGNTANSGILNINVNTGTAQGPLTFNGTVSAADANLATRPVNVSGTNSVTFNGVISDFSSSGKIALTQLGSGTTTLTASNTFSGSTATVSFAGIPGFNYTAQRSTNLVGWASLLTTNAPAGGLFQVIDNFSDLGVVPSSAYYRLIYNP
jgi:autotransporter-associated beta strand protein